MENVSDAVLVQGLSLRLFVLRQFYEGLPVKLKINKKDFVGQICRIELIKGGFPRDCMLVTVYVLDTNYENWRECYVKGFLDVNDGTINVTEVQG